MTNEIYSVLENTATLQYTLLSSTIQSIETKAGNVLTAIGVFLPILLALLGSGRIDIHNQPPSFFIALLLFLFTAVLEIFVLRDKEFKINPDIATFYHDFKDSNESDMKEQSLIAMSAAINYNGESVLRKSKLFNRSLYAFYVGIIFLIIGIVKI